MRYIRFIAFILAIFATTSCYVDDIKQTVAPSNGSDEITVIARVARFVDREVDTRGTKNDAEANVTCMAVAIFPIENGAIGDCVFYDFKIGNQLLFTINRQEMKNGAYIYNVDAPYVMYVFANLPSMTEETCANMSLAQMKAMAFEVEGVDIVADGFPMIGSLGDAITPEGDGKTFILKPGSATNPTLPLVNGEESDLLNVPMKAMFSKINFSIKVTPDQTVETHLTPRFTLNNYTVHNVPKHVDFTKGGDSDTDVIEQSFVNPLPLTSDSNIAKGAQSVNFTFYLPERYLTPTNQAHDGSKHNTTGYYKYPFPVVNGKYRDEDLNLRQRFKPLLPDGQKATYVTINGTFSDHQQHEFNVTYDIYLGEDNYGNFDIERNWEYYHNITIRGILNSDDQVAYDPNKEMPVAIDHRVNVNRVEPIIINLRRETLLDSHFEVRPLRIRKNPDYTGDLSKAKVKVEVVYDKTPAQKWIGLERSFGNGVQSGSSTYLVATDLAADRQNSLGKRKYFTTDLTSSTLAGASTLDNKGYSTSGGQSVIVPITETDEAIWIYVDEALVAEAGDAIRKATIRVSVAEDGTNYGTPIDYVIQQRQLFPVTYGDHTYLIEYEEEYLHNFDASDSYGQTDYEGMQWGLDGALLSFDHRALYLDQSGIEIFTQIVNGIIVPQVAPYYDFYLANDTDNDGAIVHKNAGYEFTKEIIDDINNPNRATGEFETIDILNLSQEPKSAIEYCYNKNKRTADGHIIWQKTDGSFDLDNYVWYLPAIDEIENIVMSEYGDGQKTYTRFLDFQAKYYWSSQPAYLHNHAHYDNAIHRYGSYMIDNRNYARSTSVSYNNGTYSRQTSGMDGYYETLHITFHGRIWEVLNASKYKGTTYATPYQYTSGDSDQRNIPGPSWDKHLGYDPRSQYNRVRCVRKQ